MTLQYFTAEGLKKLQDELNQLKTCLLYTSDAADERSSVDLGGRRIIKKKKEIQYNRQDNKKIKKRTKKRHDEKK